MTIKVNNISDLDWYNLATFICEYYLYLIGIDGNNYMDYNNKNKILSR